MAFEIEFVPEAEADLDEIRPFYRNQILVLVIRGLLEDAVTDELIAQHPDFRASVERARQQKAKGKVKSLAELREKYAAE